MLGDLGKLIVAKDFKKLPKVQKIARSGHADLEAQSFPRFGMLILIFLGSVSGQRLLRPTTRSS